eukprot:1065338-Rhodomonas_salina.3
MHSDVANLEGQCFAYKSQWWRTGNKSVGVCNSVTVWTLEPDLTLPLRDRSLDPPIPLAIPDSADARSYFDHTPSGPYQHRPGQHVWTDGSMIATNEVQLVGAGITGYMPEFIRFSLNVGGPATSQRGEMAAAARALDLQSQSPFYDLH